MEGVTMSISESRRRANEKYNANAYEEIKVRVYKGEKDAIKLHSEKKDGGSVNRFINRAIRETIERDNEEQVKE